MLITFFPRLWHGICPAFNAEIAENAEKNADWGKATANGTAFNATGHGRGAVAPWRGKPAGA